MRIGFYQFYPRFGAKEENLSTIEAALSGLKADLLVLPELCTTGYLFASREELFALAEPLPEGRTIKRLRKAAKRNRISLVVGVAERTQKQLFNSAVLLTKDGSIYTYRKTHLFLHEKELFSPGDTPWQVYELDGVKVGMLICFDYLFPEAARKLALSGVQIICHPSNLVLPEYGQLVSRVRSIENRVFWILANRYGVEKRRGERLHFTGASQIVGPDGKILARAPVSRECLRVVEINPEAARDKRVTPFNDLFEDRRRDLY